jgi:hypothetical protein
LIGKAKKDKDSVFTWLQLEKHKVDFSNRLIRGIRLIVFHLLDFLKYRWTGKNVSPCGLSEYTEKNPIKIDASNIAKCGVTLKDVLNKAGFEDFLKSASQKTKQMQRKIKLTCQRMHSSTLLHST